MRAAVAATRWWTDPDGFRTPAGEVHAWLPGTNQTLCGRSMRLSELLRFSHVDWLDRAARHRSRRRPCRGSLPTGSIESRVRTLPEPGVTQLLDYEQNHANRTQVVQLLETRLEALRSGEAEPSSGDPGAVAPELGGGTPAPHRKASPQTEGPKQNPPSQGVPTNPAQPRR